MPRRNTNPFPEIHIGNDSSPSRATCTRLAQKVEKWFAKNQRNLPWREGYDPYRVWISEIMLQQTRVETVLPFYERFLDRFPSIKSLSESEEGEVLSLWSGLGYYSRARNLYKAARIVSRDHGERIPSRIEDLLSLPGIGRYTAGAILSIAFDLPYPIVDGNVVRVLSRVFALPHSFSSQKDKTVLWKLAGRLVARAGSPREFNQGLMELGAIVCLPRNPGCERCPLSRPCKARSSGNPEAFPISGKKPRSEFCFEVCAVVQRRGRFLLARRGSEGRYGGMWEFPRIPLESPVDGAHDSLTDLFRQHLGLHLSSWETPVLVEYGIMHFRVKAEFLRCKATGQGRIELFRYEEFGWYTLNEIENLPLPAPVRRFIQNHLEAQ